MANELCHDCGRLHERPRCGFNQDLLCLRCNKPRGLRWNCADGKPDPRMSLCWRCTAVEDGILPVAA